MISRQLSYVATLVMILTHSLCSATEAKAQDTDTNWLQWRGPNRDGLIGASNWPDALAGDALREQWRVELGPSYSGPIVTADRVFVTETVDRKFEAVRALDRKSGKQLWEAKWEGSMTVPFFAKANGDWIRATPACDGERLFVAGMRDLLVCLDVNSGKELWRIDFVEELGSKVPSFGFASSPLVHGEYVYVQAGGGFVKVNKKTGEIVWRVLDDGGGMSGSAFSSPYLTEIEGQ
jgi:outer membrane protein assembly factor BamB